MPPTTRRAAVREAAVAASAAEAVFGKPDLCSSILERVPEAAWIGEGPEAALWQRQTLAVACKAFRDALARQARTPA